MKTGSTVAAISALVLTGGGCARHPIVFAVPVGASGPHAAAAGPPTQLVNTRPKTTLYIYGQAAVDPDTCTTTNLGSINVQDSLGTPIATSQATGYWTVPAGAGSCVGKTLKYLCLGINWQGPSDKASQHAFSYSSTLTNRTTPVLVSTNPNMPPSGYASCFG